MEYRRMKLEEAERIKEIDATCYIKNAWRYIDGVLTLVEIDFTDYELPNGFCWHLEHFKQTIENGGYAFGCFDTDVLVGYGTLHGQIFGEKSKYILLDQLFVSKDYRNKGIGRRIVSMCTEQAKFLGANKLYLCAGSSEDTIAFYKKIGCVTAAEINRGLFENDPNDMQLELQLI